MRLWGGRFGEGPDARMADFTRSIEIDAALALDDLDGAPIERATFELFDDDFRSVGNHATRVCWGDSAPRSSTSRFSAEFSAESGL